jgi:son of sevenless-like protein
MTVLEQRLRGQDTTAKRLVPSANLSAPQPIMPKNMKKLKFLDIDVTEFARQLTIVESKLYGKIKPTECLNKTWQKKIGDGDPEPAPNVKALILHSNQLTNWVAEMILTQQDVKRRVVVIKHFVLVADVCLTLELVMTWLTCTTEMSLAQQLLYPDFHHFSSWYCTDSSTKTNLGSGSCKDYRRTRNHATPYGKHQELW